MAGGAAGAGKLGLKGFMAGGAAVELRFKETIPDSRPAKRKAPLMNSTTTTTIIMMEIMGWDILCLENK